MWIKIKAVTLSEKLYFHVGAGCGRAQRLELWDGSRAEASKEETVDVVVIHSYFCCFLTALTDLLFFTEKEVPLPFYLSIHEPVELWMCLLLSFKLTKM